MQRDIVFFVNGIPDRMLIWERDYFISKVEPNVVEEMKRLASRYPDLHHYIEAAKGNFSAAGFRTSADSQEDAFAEAHRRASGILDGYSFLVEDHVPELWPLMQIREGNSEDVSLRFFELKGWVTLHSKDGLSQKLWDERTMGLLHRFMSFFELVAKQHRVANEFRDQVELSAKMYRHGRRAAAYGIEFLCKFTALEGLVCGSATKNKAELLRTRISALFRHEKNIVDTVNSLWKLRCEGSHQGKAFSHEFSHHLSTLDRLILAALVFACDHMSSVQTISDLWAKAPSYVLPPELLMERPQDIPRYPALSVFMDTRLSIKGVGPGIDAIFDEYHKLHPPEPCLKTNL